MKLARLILLASLAGLAGLAAAASARAQQPDTSMWITDGNVAAVVRIGGTLFEAGQFTRVGPNIGSGVPFDTASGQPRSPFARISGEVNAVVADGNGGWFVGGQFTGVSGLPRRNLVHLLADGSVAAWSPDPDSAVFALARSGSTLYVGGHFEHLGGAARFKIGAVDVTTGAATAFDPNPQMLAPMVWPYVNSLAVGPGVVYAGGFFHDIGGQTRWLVAALDPVTGAATSWNAVSNGVVYAILPSDTSVYLGGTFSTIGGASRSGLAQLSATTAAATAWDPHPDGAVRCLVLGGTQLYAGGLFTHMGAVSRNSLAAFDRATGALMSFDANAQGGAFGASPVYSVALLGMNLFVAGDFATIGGQPRHYLASLDPASGAARAWTAEVNLTVNAVAAAGSTVFAGGRFWVGGGAPRSNLAAIDLASGHPTSWTASTNLRVEAMVTDGTSLYLGGYFTLVNDLGHAYLAKLDAATGAVSSWNPGPGGNVVTCLALDGSLLYVGGYGGGSIPMLARVDAVNGAVLPWNPVTAGGPINKIVPDPPNGAVTVASQGGFWSFRASDAATLWSAAMDGPAYSAVQIGGKVYMGGYFYNVNGQPRRSLAAFDAVTGTLLPWSPPNDGIVSALATDGARVYVGGPFRSMAGVPRFGFAVLDTATGAADPYDARLFSIPLEGAFVIAPIGTDLFLAGGFMSAGNVAAFDFARLPAPPPLAVPLPEPPQGLRLDAGPVPAVTSTLLRFWLPVDGRVWLDVVDLQGRRVATLLGGVPLPAGPGSRTLETRGLAPGIYLARLRTSAGSATRRIVIEK